MDHFWSAFQARKGSEVNTVGSTPIVPSSLDSCVTFPPLPPLCLLLASSPLLPLYSPLAFFRTPNRLSINQHLSIPFHTPLVKPQKTR